MFPTELRSPRERRLIVLAWVVSAIAWLAVVVSIVGIIYGVFIAIGIAIAHALWLGHVRGNGVRLGPQQLPHLWNKVTAAAQRVGLREPPAAYLMQSGGVLNAFATKLFGRRFVILNSALVDACERGDGVGAEIDFVIAHETAHLAAGHLSWFLLPVRIIPLLGPAWSRACEYTCDRAGQAFVGNLETSSRALAILAAGPRAGRALDLDAFVAQRAESGRFWMAVYELNSTHPYLPKRIAALREAEQPGAATAVGRNVVAYPLAPVFGMFVGGGAASAPLLVVMMIGMLAAIALPSFERYLALSRQAATRAQRAAAEDSAPPTASASNGEAITPAGVVRGDRFDWTLELPGRKWELLSTEEARKQNELADRWLTRRDLDAHIMVIGEPLNGQKVTLDAYAEAVIGNVRKAATKLKVVRQSAFGGGRLIELRSTVHGMELGQLLALYVHGNSAYQVYAFSSTATFDRASPEMMTALASFQPAE